MKNALRYLSGIGRSILPGLVAPASFRPDFHQTAILQQMAGAVMPAAPLDRTQTLEDSAVAFFEEAAAAAGFLQVDDIERALADYKDHKPTWCRALLDEARYHCQVGLPVYDRRTSALGDASLWAQPVEKGQEDRLYRLRPHRFGFLPRLAMAAALGGGDALPSLLTTLDRWLERVEKTGGGDDAYFSNLVVIYRLLAISWAAPFVAAAAKKGDRRAATSCLRLFQLLVADVQYLLPRLGESVPNNHLLADRFAAWFLAASYPSLCSESDRQSLERDWQEELARQFQADGTNFEQSLHYHELGCEMALAYLVVSLRRGERPRDETLALIRQMLRFQVALSDERGNSFALGDATDDPLLPLDAGGGWAGGAWQMLYQALFDAEFAAPGDNAIGTERAYWLLVALPPGDRPLQLSTPPTPVGGFALFSDSGYAAFRDEFHAQTLLFRSGPRPGVEISPGHAMSDLLSVCWTLSGQPVFEASGTFSYCARDAAPDYGPARARDYFRSPAAHNGLVLKGHDPLGTPKGRFRGADNGARVTTVSQALPRTLAWGEGRLEESGPLNGYRRGVLQVCGRYTLVYDRLPPLSQDAQAACHWQFSPEARVTIRNGRQTLAGFKDFSTYLCASSGFGSVDCVQGQTEPPGGWVSRRYGDMVEAPQLICPIMPSAQDLAVVFGSAAEGEEPPEVEVVGADAEGLVLEIRQGQRRSIACFGHFVNGLNCLPFGLAFQGSALWLDIEDGRCRELRTLGLHSLSSEDLGLDLAEGRGAPQGRGWRSLSGDVASGTFCGRWECPNDG